MGQRQRQIQHTIIITSSTPPPAIPMIPPVPRVSATDFDPTEREKEKNIAVSIKASYVRIHVDVYL